MILTTRLGSTHLHRELQLLEDLAKASDSCTSQLMDNVCFDALLFILNLLLPSPYSPLPLLSPPLTLPSPSSPLLSPPPLPFPSPFSPLPFLSPPPLPSPSSPLPLLFLSPPLPPLLPLSSDQTGTQPGWQSSDHAHHSTKGSSLRQCGDGAGRGTGEGEEHIGHSPVISDHPVVS